MALELSVGGANKVFRFADGQTVVIGGGVSSDILVGSPDIDTRHALIAHDGSHWRLFDLRSRSGTKLNGRSVVQERLADGDWIGIGSFRFEVRISAPANAESAEPVQASAKRPVRSSEKQREVGDNGERVAMGPFFLEQMIHRGSSGRFYLASWNEKPGRSFCVKVFARHLAADENAMYRFCRGVTTAAKIKHPNIVRLYRGGKAGAKWYLLMEWMAGRSLRDRLMESPDRTLSPAEVVAMGMAICRALEVAAEHRVVHRKITPSSILFSDSGVPKLGDFMLMRELDGDQAQVVTKAGEALGEMAYMAPEQATGSRQVDGRSDLYSLAASMFEALTGRPPHVGRTIVELIKDIHERPVVRASSINRKVPSSLDSILALALAKDIDARYQSPAQLRNDLEQTGIGA